MRFDRLYGLSGAITISRAQAEERMDYRFHQNALRAATAQSITLTDLRAEIIRGLLTSAEAKRVSYPVFHTGDFSAEPGGDLHFPNRQPAPECVGTQVIAQPGDILLARVDRCLHRKIARVVEGHAAITDCIFRVRVPDRDREHVFRSLSSEHGGLALASVARGVGARMLSKRDLLRLPLPLGTHI